MLYSRLINCRRILLSFSRNGIATCRLQEHFPSRLGVSLLQMAPPELEYRLNGSLERAFVVMPHNVARIYAALDAEVEMCEALLLLWYRQSFGREASGEAAKRLECFAYDVRL